jgi:two-component system alkaline phosphatase synthesis response regulator PhoP
LRSSTETGTTLHKILIIARDPEKIRALSTELSLDGFTCIIAEDAKDICGDITNQSIDLALVDLDSSPASIWAEFNWDQLRKINLEKQLPVVVLISKNMLHEIDIATGIDDFVVEPYDLPELVIRIKRTLKKASKISCNETIRCGDLLIDAVKCEAYLDGRILALTFTEYELLKFMATNKGRVFSREVLLNEVWGYDYYGGDRTVDVHIRRLRGKIEDSDHTFIDTVRNIGYKFRECNWSLPLEADISQNSDLLISSIPNS